MLYNGIFAKEAEMSLPDRQKAYDLLCEYTKNPNLIKHMLVVEAAMRASAVRFGENTDL